jgi:hypothetical protein
MVGADKAAIVAKYRVTTQFEDALKIIAPAPERRAECERDVASALWGAEVATKLKSVRTPAQHKEDLQKLAKTLRTAVNLAPKAFPLEYQIRRGKDSWIGEHLKRHLEETEQAINWTSERVRKGSPRVAFARIQAVDSAYLLLKRYGKRLPGLSHEGPWHKLAKTLLGKDESDATDLFKILKWRLGVLTSVLTLIRATGG